jgi:hypothetical protein
MTFWTESNFEPKRAFRFKIDFGPGSTEQPIPYFYLKSARKPSFEINTTQHKVGGREFNFPGTVRWNDVTLAFVDDVDNSVITKLVDVIASSNYPDILNGAGSGFTPEALRFISKDRLTKNITTEASAQASVSSAQVKFDVEQLNAEGNVVERWSLYNPIITKLEQDDLDYSKEELSVYTLTVKYDWASFEDLSS